MRISIGLVVLADLIIRARSIAAHYTDEGILPIHVLKEFYDKQLYYSFHNLNGSLAWQSTLFILNAIIAIALIFGFKTRLTTILAWIFMVSLQNRNPFIQQGGDDLFRLVLFFGMFLPWGNFYSYDAGQKQSIQKKYYFSPATFGYMLLIASVYFFSALLKTSPEWRSEGTAIYYVLSLDQLKVGIGPWLYQFPVLMKFLTHFVMFIEIVSPVLFFIPFKNSNFKTIGLVLIIMLHIGIALNVYVGLFFVIGISSTLGMLPSGFMDWLDAKILKTKHLISNRLYRSPLRLWACTFRNIFLTTVIGFCLLVNLGNLRCFDFTIKPQVMLVSNALKLEQFWGMFSPNIYKDDGWYIYRGLRLNNSDWDIYNNKEGVDHEKPEHIVKMYESDRWRKFAENYQKRNYNFIKPYYCRYLIRKWNKEHPDNKIDGLYIVFLKEVSLPDYKTSQIKEENSCLCYENEPAK